MDNIVLWIDDVRNPEDSQWTQYINERFGKDIPVVWLKSYDEFVSWLNATRPLPMHISFDHDLGLNPDGTECNGYDCAKYLMEMMLDFKVRTLPDINVHSANPVGKENIEQLFINYKKHLVPDDDQM